jgi:hypothetical protein
MCDSWQTNEAKHITWRYLIVGFFSVVALVAVIPGVVVCLNYGLRTAQLTYACNHTQSSVLENVCAEVLREAMFGK